MGSKEKVLGKKKTNTQPNAILNPENNKLVVSKNEIKAVTLKYCKDTLENNQPHPKYQKEINMKRKNVEDKLSKENCDFIINQDTFDGIISKFKKSRKKSYDFLIKAGSLFQSVVFKFCQVMFQDEVFPEQFNNTTLHMIFKGGKGRREKLTNNRFIHSKSWLPRTAEALCVEEGMKWPLIEKSSIYQIGGQPGHRYEEHVFILKSVTAKYRSEGKQIIIQSSDLEKFFDKEMLEDAVLTCIKRGANTKACRLWYNLNRNTKIGVRT